MSWHASARAAAQRLGLQPRYLRRARWISKARVVRSSGAPLRSNLRYVLLDAEPNNFTYELANQDELAHWVAEVAGVSADRAAATFDEAGSDAVLAQRLREATRGRWWWTKRAPPYGKRLAWYALVRLLRPGLTIETGVHDGLGSLLVLRALERNAQEGSDGRLVSFDINPAAGWLVGQHPAWELRVEPGLDGMARVLGDRAELGLFIHDSLHTYENERAELQTAAARLVPGGVLISDNAHATDALRDTCAEFGLAFFVFHERPRGHFYRGGAMGAGRRSTSS